MTKTVQESEIRLGHHTTPAGVGLEFADHGREDGPAVMLLHGVTDSWRSFEGVMRLLPGSIRAVALSQRGHGGSDRPEERYRTRDFAADAVALADGLGIDRFVLVGHSMGAANAVRIAIDAPERVAGLGLAGAFARFGTNAGVVDFYETQIRSLRDPIDPAMAREFQAATLAQPVAPEFFEMVVGESLRVPARVWRSAFEGLLEDDFADELAGVRAPTRLWWGDRDVFSLRGDQQALLDGIRGSRLSVYERAGHGLHWENPRRFARDVEDLVETAFG